MSNLRRNLEDFAAHGSIWLVSDAGFVVRLSRPQYEALPKNDPRRKWTARINEDDAIKLAARRKWRVN